MTTFDFNAWCTTTQLKEATVEALKKEDIDSEAALKLLTEKDVEELGLSVGQKRVLEAALKKLKLEEQAKTEPGDVTDPVTTKSLAKDSGLEEILKKIEGAGSLEDSLLALGTTDLFPGKTPAAQNSSTLNSTLPRLDNDPHVFLGQQQQKAIGTKQGEKPLLIPDFINLGTYDSSEEEQEIGNNSSGAKIIFRATKAKPKLEQITLSMWVASNSRIMYELLKKGKLSATTSDIADYLAYTVKFAELLESHTLALALILPGTYPTFKRTCFSINWEKAVSPTQRLTFLGIEIDTVLRQLCLPESKLCELRQLLSETLIKRSVTKRDLQSLVGKLNFAARVVFGGRTFLRRTIDVMNTLSRPHHHIRVNKQLRDDLSWWASFLSVFNGKTFFIDSAPVSFEEFSTDACPIGGGGFFQGDWFYTNWAIDHPDLAGAHINLKETFTVLLALCRWKHQLRDKWIVVHSDNSMTISVLNKGTCRNPQVMQWLRSIFWLSATFNFRITARYIPSKANTMADAISRLHDPAFCHAFRAQLRRVQETNDSSQPHFSQLAFSSFPLQVQYMLRSSYSKRN
ncbi:uncharacterized protein LOC144652227 [Oculina patagonica]